jgi:hypothetical protein
MPSLKHQTKQLKIRSDSLIKALALQKYRVEQVVYKNELNSDQFYGNREQRVLFDFEVYLTVYSRLCRVLRKLSENIGVDKKLHINKLIPEINKIKKVRNMLEHAEEYLTDSGYNKKDFDSSVANTVKIKTVAGESVKLGEVWYVPPDQRSESFDMSHNADVEFKFMQRDSKEIDISLKGSYFSIGNYYNKIKDEYKLKNNPNPYVPLLTSARTIQTVVDVEGQRDEA